MLLSGVIVKRYSPAEGKVMLVFPLAACGMGCVAVPPLICSQVYVKSPSALKEMALSSTKNVFHTVMYGSFWACACTERSRARQQRAAVFMASGMKVAVCCLEVYREKVGKWPEDAKCGLRAGKTCGMGLPRSAQAGSDRPSIPAEPCAPPYSA